MATIQDRRNPSRKARVTSDGELIIRGVASDGSILTTDTKDESVIYDDYTSGTVAYVCYAPMGTLSSSASWKIKRLNKVAGLVVKYADGNDTYTHIADDRASLIYS